MTPVLFVPGLGDKTNMSLSSYWNLFEKRGLETKFVSCPVAEQKFWKFQDRVDAVLGAIDTEKYNVYLVGNSAGGLAVLIAAGLRKDRIAGIIVQSPASPLGIIPLAWPLLSKIWRYLPQMLTFQNFTPSEKDYEFIALNGLNHNDADKMIFERSPISGREATRLAIYPPRLISLPEVPIVLSYGGKDHWIAPRAHEALSIKLDAMTRLFLSICSPYAGHLPGLHATSGNMHSEEAVDFVISNA